MSRALVGDDVVITVLTTDASVWTFGIVVQSDGDRDGILDAYDECPDSSRRAVVDRNGCSIDQLCPCAGPRGPKLKWRNHGAYVSCVTHAAGRLRRADLISGWEQHHVVREADRSHCGRQRPRHRGHGWWHHRH